jgi:long-chain acyl-CoA synthetase
MQALRTLQDLVRALPARGEHAAVVTVADDGTTETLSYAALGERALRLASGLVAAGVRPGTMVALFGPNSAAWITVRLALAACGAVAVALDDLATDAELAVLMPDSGARLIFAASAHLPRLARLADAPTRTVYTLDGGDPGSKPWTQLIAMQAGPLPEIAPERACMLVFTSGTTGTPKSFLLSHANLVANVTGLAAEGIVGANDRALLPLPLHHVYPLTVGCLTALAGGTTIVLPPGVTGPQIVSALQRGRVTVIVGVPRLYAALAAGLEARVNARGAFARRIFATLLAVSLAARKRLDVRIGRVLFASLHRQLAPDLWLMASGGAKFEAELIWKLEALGWEVLSGYGLAETASILTANRRGRARIGTEGTPLPGVQLRLGSTDAAGIGEIETRGPAVFGGYRNDPEANAAAFTGDRWFRTGDLGAVDAGGFVTITGRVKEMIVLGGGKNVFPEEIEKVYADSPCFREVAVLERAGALVALVVPNLEAIAATGNRRIDDVVRVALAERSRLLASFQRIAGYTVTRDPLPRTRLGKYQRFLLPELYERAKAGASPARRAELSDADRALLAQSPAREIWAWLAARYPDHELALDLSPQLDLGIDSLEWVTMTLEIAERFGVRLTEQDAADASTLRDLLARASAKEAASPKSPASLTPGQRAWLDPPEGGLRAAGVLLNAVNIALMRGIFRLRVAGLEHVPTRGPFVIACNHLSDLDPLVVAAALGRARLERIWWGGDVGRLFESGTGRALARIAHIFPVDERAPATAIALGEEVLRRGNALVWFPESWRSPDGTLQEFRPGIGHLLNRIPAPVVPARIAGTFEAMPRGQRVPRPTPVSIVFGAATNASGSPTQIAAALHDAVAALPQRA